jgi:hypothetical protein
MMGDCSFNPQGMPACRSVFRLHVRVQAGKRAEAGGKQAAAEPGRCARHLKPFQKYGLMTSPISNGSSRVNTVTLCRSFTKWNTATATTSV